MERVKRVMGFASEGPSRMRHRMAHNAMVRHTGMNVVAPATFVMVFGFIIMGIVFIIFGEGLIDSLVRLGFIAALVAFVLFALYVLLGYYAKKSRERVQRDALMRTRAANAKKISAR